MGRRNMIRMCAKAAVFAIAVGWFVPAVHAQAAPTSAQAKQQIVKAIETEAEAYKAAIGQMPIEVRQSVRYYDASGHLKSTRLSSFRYAAVADAAKDANAEGAATATLKEQSSGVFLSDGVSLPLLFLPGSIAHLSLSVDTSATGPWTLHFKSDPCGPPEVRRHWMEASVESRCVEGEAIFDPASESILRIQMRLAGLPIGFRSLAYPMGVIVIELSNDAVYGLLKPAGGPPRLVPVKARYVTYTTRSRTVVDQAFEFAASAPSQHQTPSGSARE